MRRYKNLPAINVELLDGNLRVDKTPRGPITLVIGTAIDGPNEAQYLVTDSNVAASVFGSESPLIQRMAEAKLGGAKNIILYRIGGISASIQGLFGADSAITAVEANVESNTKYKMYLGPNPDPDASTPGSPTVLIIYSGSNIVYSNVPGSEVDVGLFTVEGFDNTFSHVIGTPTQPVALEDALTAIDTNTDIYVTSTAETTHNLAGSTLVGTTIVSVKVNGAVTTAYTYVDTTDVLTWDSARSIGDAVEIVYIRPGTVAGASYVAGEDNTSPSWKTLYELLDSAYTSLETTLATNVCVDKAILDAPNIADGSTDTDRLEYLRTDETDGVKSYYWGTNKILYKYSGTDDDATHAPTTPTVSELPANTTTVEADADLDAHGRPIVKYRYNEVNFAHQLGSWCHVITENERFVQGSIGTSLPVSTTTAGLARWIGSLPTTNALGNIIANGSGLLGNKFMVGSTTRTPGFFLTDSGTVDGNVQTDRNGAPVDLGKYFSIVAGAVVTPNSGAFGTTAKMVNGYALYGSLTSTVTAGNSTTNKFVPNVAIPFILKKTKLDELTLAKYVTFTNTANGVVVVSGSLPTAPASDYDFISTSIIIASIVTSIRNRLQPFLGKGINQALIAAAETAVEAILQTAVKAGAIVKYKFSVTPGDTAYSLRVPLKIVPVFELREVDIPISLAYNV